MTPAIGHQKATQGGQLFCCLSGMPGQSLSGGADILSRFRFYIYQPRSCVHQSILNKIANQPPGQLMGQPAHVQITMLVMYFPQCSTDHGQLVNLINRDQACPQRIIKIMRHISDIIRQIGQLRLQTWPERQIKPPILMKRSNCRPDLICNRPVMFNHPVNGLKSQI